MIERNHRRRKVENIQEQRGAAGPNQDEKFVRYKHGTRSLHLIVLDWQISIHGGSGWNEGRSMPLKKSQEGRRTLDLTSHFHFEAQGS